jgi:hypothetical protein
MTKLKLPQTYSEEQWIRGGSIPQHKQYIGKHYLSWSQIESYNDKKGFNTGFDGCLEYILNKFSKIKFPDMGWGSFGQEIESYITLRDKDLANLSKEDVEVLNDAKNNLNKSEKEILHKIKPLGIYQREICYYVKELDIIVLGYIDDMTFPNDKNEIELLRDYKTKSEASKKDLHDDKKHQIELYTLALIQEGFKVLKAEYCIIERGGGYECMKGGGRQSLFVKDNIWYEPYSWSDERLKETHKLVVKTAKEISELYSVYNKFFG